MLFARDHGAGADPSGFILHRICQNRYAADAKSCACACAEPSDAGDALMLSDGRDNSNKFTLQKGAKPCVRATGTIALP